MFKRKIIAFLMSIILFLNIPLLGFTSVYADDGITATNPLLMPLSGWLTAVAIGTGIIGKNVTESANQLIANVANNLKEKEIQKSLEDENYNSPFRVISGGSDKTPQKPNNNNKNGAWFALGAATAGASAMLFEEGAMETAMQTFNDLKAYQKYMSELGVYDINNLLTSSSASNIALQLAKYSNSAVTQFDRFLHSDFWTEQNLSVDDCIFNVNADYGNLNTASPKYPQLIINVYKKDSNIKKIRINGNPFKYKTINSEYFNYSGYYVDFSNDNVTFLNDDNVSVYTKHYKVQVYSRSPVNDGEEDNFSYNIRNDNNIDKFQVFGTSSSGYFYFGYLWAYENPWGLTNNVYNVNQTFDVNFPDWKQGIMEILGQQLQGIQIGGITQPNVTWDPTQEQIQTGSVPQNVITQYINNYQNPESIPDDELNPDPNPDPDPDPNPEPEPEPVPESALDTGAQSLWEWAVSKIALPSDIWDKVPFSIPYDMYLLVKALFPTGSSKKRMLKVSRGSTLNPDGITISSNFEAYGQNTREYNQSNRWTDNAPIINLDLHFTYHDVSGDVKTFDYVKVVDLGQYGYFAMIIYIGVYITWMAQILVFIKNMF